jgi:hypothetical protein
MWVRVQTCRVVQILRSSLPVQRAVYSHSVRIIHLEYYRGDTIQLMSRGLERLFNSRVDVQMSYSTLLILFIFLCRLLLRSMLALVRTGTNVAAGQRVCQN